MANNPNPQEFNRDLGLNEPEDLTNFVNQYKAKEFATEVYPEQVSKVDTKNVLAAAGPAAASDHKTYISPEIRNRQKEALLRTVGSVALNTADAADTLYRQHVGFSIEEEMDKINKEFLPDSDLVLPSGELPPELKEAGDRLDTLASAYKAGKMRESHYLVKVADAAQKLKQKYGITRGYGKVVDDMIRQTLGFDPANRLREHSIQQAEAAAAKAAAQTPLAQERFEKSILYEYDHLPPEVAANPEAYNNPEGWKYVNQYVHQRVSYLADAQIKMQEGKTAAQGARGLIGLKAEQLAAAQGYNLRQMKSELAGLQRRSTDMKLRQSQPLSNEEQLKKEALASQLKQIIGTATQNVVAELPVDTPQADVDNVIKFSDSMTNLLTFGLGDPTASKIAEIAIARQKDNLNSRFFTDEMMQRHLVTDEKMQTALTQYGALGFDKLEGSEQDRAVEIISSNFLGKAYGGTSVGASIANQPGAVKGVVLSTHLNNVMDPNGDPELAAESLEALLEDNPAAVLRGTKNQSELSSGIPDPQADLYYRMATKEFAEGVVRTGSPALVQKYSQFLNEQWEKYNTNRINTASLALKNRPSIEVELNDQTMEFSVKPRAEKPTGPRGGIVSNLPTVAALEAAYEWSRVNGVKDTIDELNRHTRSYMAAYKALGVEDPRDYVRALFAGVGWNPDAKFEPSAYGAVSNWIVEAVKKSVKKEEAPKTSE